MYPQKKTLVLAFILLALIAFDTIQQKYYVDTFLSPDLEYSVLELLQRHALSWLTWIMVGIPLNFSVQRLINNNLGVVRTSTGLSLLGVVVLHISLTVVVFTLIRLFVSDLNMAQFMDLFVFHLFQKTLIFFMADCTVIILLFNRAKELKIESQYVEIKHLESSQPLESTAQSNAPEMVIRTGNKINRVLLQDIVWIQSDDYCSKIHTKSDQSFSLRKSLKSLEVTLQPYGFVRIHRGALLNLDSVNQLNLDKSIVKLKNDLELPVSKSRVKTLRESLFQASV